MQRPPSSRTASVFTSCSVERIVPAAPHKENPLDAGAEDFSEWVVDWRALRTTIVRLVCGMTPTDALEAYIEGKIFTLNCSHAIAAYLRFAHGLDRID